MTAITGKNFIAGRWVEGDSRFRSDNPATGAQNENEFFTAGPELAEQAVSAAENAFEAFSTTSLADRANFLREIATQIESRGAEITAIAHAETALPEARLEGERGRTVNQLRFFADWIEQGDWLQARIDQADPDRAPLPKVDIRTANKAIGPVAVFGASNFPLAFSTAGGDTASALAAGCPVVVKAHEAHPGTCEIVAQAIEAAIKVCKMPDGVFSQLQGGDHRVGHSLVTHPKIKAVGFTGSLVGGRALFDLAVSRPEPIPFYGELGSINPVFLLSEAMANRADSIAANWVQSLTMGVGQFCTNPGVVVLQAGEQCERFKSAALEASRGVSAQPLLTRRIAKSYQSQVDGLADNGGLDCLLATGDQTQDFQASPCIYNTDAATWLKNEALSEEVFGPCGIIVECDNVEEMVSVANALQGQLTATIQLDGGDEAMASRLVRILEEKAGRVLMNGFPTGVEVCHSMVHGGPYPASTDVRSTSVGSLAIQRFVRPVSYQSFPDSLLPLALQNANTLGINRLVDGQNTSTAI